MEPGKLNGPADRRAIEAKAAEFVEQVGIPNPWDLNEFAHRLTTAFGKPVRIVPMSAEVPPQDLPDTDFTGVIIETEQSMTICYADSGSELHQMTIIMHELGHRLLGHVTTDHVMCRSTFRSPQESEAERFARTLLYQARGGDTLQLAPHMDDPEGVTRLGGALADIE